MRTLSQIPEPGEEQDPEVQAQDREDRLTRRVTWWVEGPLITILTLILLYYGGNSGPNGDSSYIDHGRWQDAVFWPIVIIGFVLLVIDRTGRKRLPRPEREAQRAAERAMPKAERRAARSARHQPARRVSRWIARRIIARQDRKARARGPKPQRWPGVTRPLS